MTQLNEFLTRLLAGALTLASANLALAQTAYPEGSVKLVIGFPAGTPPDTVARLLAEKMQASLGKSIIVESVPGAGGNIAADRVAKSPPDGHTLLLAGNASIVVNSSLYDKLPYDPSKDLAPISQVAMAPNMLVVNPDVSVGSVAELIAFAKAQPDTLTYGHAGVGISQHLGAEVFKQMTGVKVRPVAYSGSNSIVPDVLMNRVSMCFCGMSIVLPHVREGKLKALAVTSLKRTTVAPEVPTLDEAGLKGFDVTVWYGLMAPASTPSPIIERLNKEVRNALATGDVRAKLESIGMISIGGSAADFAAVIETETPHWKQVVTELGLRSK